MKRYILNRLLTTIFVVVGAAILIFTIMYFVPGDPARLILGSEASEADVQAKRELLGLTDPYIVRLGSFLKEVFLQFNLGTSWFTGVSVNQELAGRLPYTLFLGTMFVIVSTVIAVPLGISAAIHQDKWQDRFCMVLAMVLTAFPEFWLALMLVLIFSLELGLLPSFGIESWQCFILPVIAGSLASIGRLARQTRASMLNVSRADYITTARAKGVAEKKVIYKHMLPNALIPVITSIGGAFASCIAGTVIIEQVFTIPGIGTYMTNAVSTRDCPIVQGCVVVLSIFIALIMLLVDLLYGYVDPRIKAQYVAQSKSKRRRKQ